MSSITSYITSKLCIPWSKQQRQPRNKLYISTKSLIIAIATFIDLGNAIAKGNWKFLAQNGQFLSVNSQEINPNCTKGDIKTSTNHHNETSRELYIHSRDLQ